MFVPAKFLLKQFREKVDLLYFETMKAFSLAQNKLQNILFWVYSYGAIPFGV